MRLGALPRQIIRQAQVFLAPANQQAGAEREAGRVEPFEEREDTIPGEVRAKDEEQRIQIFWRWAPTDVRADPAAGTP